MSIAVDSLHTCELIFFHPYANYAPEDKVLVHHEFESLNSSLAMPRSKPEGRSGLTEGFGLLVVSRQLPFSHYTQSHIKSVG